MTIKKHSYSFLIVDHNSDDRLFVRNTLKDFLKEPSITEADCYSEAQSYLNEPDLHFDAVLLDPTFTEKSTEQVISDILKYGKETPIIILTKDREHSFRSIAYRLGISDYLVKENLTATELYRSVLFNVEHRRTLVDLKESEKRYSDLFHMSPLPMFVINVENFRFLDVNNSAIDHYGYSEDEFLSMTLADIGSDGESEKLQNILKDHDFSQPLDATANHHTKNGDTIYVEIQSNPITFKGQRAHILLAKDITDQVKYIQAIQKQNDKLKDISWVQSHVVRAPLARMMGLIDMLKSDIETDLDKDELFDHLLDSAEEFDKIIHEISKKAEKVDYNIEKARNI